MNVSLESVVQVINAFVVRTRGRVARPVNADTQLFQEGLVDSFGLVELIIELERVAAAPIPEGVLSPDDFESPRVLHGRLLELE